MGDTVKLKVPPGEPADGRVEHDDPGNARWVPARNLASPDSVARLLDDDTLAICEPDHATTLPRARTNDTGLRVGYDPYDSGLLVKGQRGRKKDLRALSEWIKQRKPDRERR